jgi:hypothetical protein
MKKLGTVLFGLLILLLVSSCADDKKFVNIDKDGVKTTLVAEPYGWANEDSKKIEGVEYELCVGNIILDVIFCETIVVPIILTGWQLYEPVGYETQNTAYIEDGIIKYKDNE